MDDESEIDAQKRAGHALRQAELATDPAVKDHWTDIAHAWFLILAKLEAMHEQARQPSPPAV
jgi:hypothetical protein